MKRLHRTWAPVLVLACSGGISLAAADTGHHEEHEHHGEHWMAPAAAAKRPNPVPADSASLARGKKIYDEHCVVCHGTAGHGDGPAGQALNPKPANLAVMGGEHSDGDFAWKLEHGRGPMPAWKSVLSQNQIWDVVNYVKSLGTSKGKSSKPAAKHHDGAAH